MGVSKRGLLLSLNFARLYLSQIKFILKMRKIFFKQRIAHSNWTSLDHCFQGACVRKSNSQFDFHPFF
jgi:hypothetical protein